MPVLVLLVEYHRLVDLFLDGLSARLNKLFCLFQAEPGDGAVDDPAGRLHPPTLGSGRPGRRQPALGKVLGPSLCHP